jgi:cellulose synthase/poly-beta-1,6-N-acetylglucosamine synthase-like glycosyltransferase
MSGVLRFLAVDDEASPLDDRVTQGAFAEVLRNRFRTELLAEATGGLAGRDPGASASGLRPRPGPLGLFVIAASAASFSLAPGTALSVLSIAAAVVFAMLALLRVALMSLARRTHQAPPRRSLSTDDLPTATILTPLFREAQALPGLVRAIDRLDYPRSKLDVKLLLEESDDETIAEARRLGLFERFDVIIVPHSLPQTKPKACNYGLWCARGDLIVIYDAEDEPDPDQLRIAAETFAAGPENLACVQAKLNFYNPEENWLTRGLMAQMTEV